ncbi:unnamed protein product [Closterium sp. Yama58-4]|nr:unnamed protein product [Closterium sp. Yama58-4]CAI5482820.1 unnamed protein product [Closterium sp. Yama58-4]
MEMIMTRAKGQVYTTDAARFDEEARAEPDVNEELRIKAESQKAIAGVYQKENGRLAEEMKSALVLLTHLAKKVQQVDQSQLDWKKYIKEACDDFLFKQETLNLNPDSETMLNALIRKAGYTPESPEGLQVAAIAKSQGKLKDASERFNDRIGKIYRFCRCYGLSREPCIFMREKRTLKGELTFAELEDFAKLVFGHLVACVGGHAVLQSRRCRSGKATVTVRVIGATSTDKQISLSPVSWSKIVQGSDPVSVTYKRTNCHSTLGSAVRVRSTRRRGTSTFVGLAGPGTLKAVEISADGKEWEKLTRDGSKAIWGIKGKEAKEVVGAKKAVSVRLTAGHTLEKITLDKVIPADWKPQTLYSSKTNFKKLMAESK